MFVSTPPGATAQIRIGTSYSVASARVSAETPPFDAATVALAQSAAALTTSAGLESIAGGGDTVSALKHAGVADRMTYVSAAGGAFLEWLEGKTLPAFEILAKRAG
jgi:phosphoglycerate kinase